MLLTGDVGVGKSILVEDVLLRLSKEVGKCQFTVFRARNSVLPNGHKQAIFQRWQAKIRLDCQIEKKMASEIQLILSLMSVYFI